MDNVDAHGQGTARCGDRLSPSFANAGAPSTG
jgi:hypothetical protein